MAVIRKHWFVFTFMNVVCLALGIGWVGYVYFAPQGALGQAAEAPESIAAEDYVRIQALRETLRLTNMDLAAMEVTAERAQQIIVTIRDWYLTNKAQLEAAEANERMALDQLRKAMRLVNIGPRDEQVLSTIPKLEQALAQRKNEQTLLVGTAATSVNPLLDNTQQRIWEISRQNKSVPASLRYVPDLTDAQIEQLQMAARKRGSGSSAYRTTEQNVLNWGQRNAIDSAQTSQTRNISGILAAEQSVLPTPIDERNGPGRPPVQE